MSDNLYRLIPEIGKHLADSRDTEGAFRGVYLDDETNKPCGAGEFVKVNLDDLIEQNTIISPDTPLDVMDIDTTEIADESDSSNNVAVIAIATITAFAAGFAVANAPRIKKWAKEKAIPSLKRILKKDTITSDKEPAPEIELHQISETTSPEQVSFSTDLIINAAYNEYRDNMSSEEAQRELIEAFVLYLESMRKVNRVANANVIDSSGKLTQGKSFLDTMANNGMLESINNILKNNPALLGQNQKKVLSEVLGYEIGDNEEYIPITVNALVKESSENTLPLEEHI